MCWPWCSIGPVALLPPTVRVTIGSAMRGYSPAVSEFPLPDTHQPATVLESPGPKHTKATSDWGQRGGHSPRGQPRMAQPISRTSREVSSIARVQQRNGCPLGVMEIRRLGLGDEMRTVRTYLISKSKPHSLEWMSS